MQSIGANHTEFQSTLPRRERRQSSTAERTGSLFQSTLPRRERRRRRIDASCRHVISIHAPAKGATLSGASESSHSSFQSTLPRRERPPAAHNMRARPGHFNPRSREGSDGEQLSDDDLAFLISIHAPAKGATQVLQVFILPPHHFNPRSREGSDILRLSYWILRTRFQSTLPRRERRRRKSVR